MGIPLNSAAGKLVVAHLSKQKGGARLDIRFRMLQPHELAAAMGFPKDYRITGNRGEQVRQIGNAVVVEQAEALCRAIFGGAA
jgi:site-specific DNA-cytosine methylase